jgi:hypothetical protein
MYVLTYAVVKLQSLAGHWVAWPKFLVGFFSSSRSDIALTHATSTSFTVSRPSLCTDFKSVDPKNRLRVTKSLYITCNPSKQQCRPAVSSVAFKLQAVRWHTCRNLRSHCVCRLLSRWVRDCNIFVYLNSLLVAFFQYIFSNQLLMEDHLVAGILIWNNNRRRMTGIQRVSPLPSNGATT